MNAIVTPIPEGMHSLTPHIVCRDANAAMDFYVSAFGAIDSGRLPGPDNKLMHGRMQIGNSSLMLVDEKPKWSMNSPIALGGTPVTLHLYVADADAALAQAVETGATLTMPAADMFWGDCYGQVRDPFGHTHIRDVSPEELQVASKLNGQGV